MGQQLVDSPLGAGYWRTREVFFRWWVRGGGKVGSRQTAGSSKEPSVLSVTSLTQVLARGQLTLKVNDLIRRIHASSTQLVLAITGGGSRAIAELLEVPGGSRTLLEAVVPYSAAALSDWLGAEPEQFCSARTARMMAMAAYRRAMQLGATEPARRADAAPLASSLAGIGCTASLVSDRPKRGPHRIHVAYQTAAETVTHSVELVKGHRNRLGEEQIAANLIVDAISSACSLDTGMSLDLLPQEQIATTRTLAPLDWQELLAGRIALVRQTDAAVEPLVTGHWPLATSANIFSGAFNPLHDGHRRMAEIAAQLLGVPVGFEISIENVDKPPLDFTEMEQRAAQFAGQTFWFTRAATFERKAELFPGATFIVGADTIRRIADPRYYDGNPAAASSAIARIAAAGCRFLVFGRTAADQFQSLGELNLPPELAGLCREVPEAQFRSDVSSTDLRRHEPD